MSFEATSWAFRQKSIKGTTKYLLTAYANRASDKNHTCFPSQKCLEDDTGLNIKTIAKATKLLMKEGYIEKTGKKKRSVPVYRVNVPPVFTFSRSSTLFLHPQKRKHHPPKKESNLTQNRGTEYIKEPSTKQIKKELSCEIDNLVNSFYSQRGRQPELKKALPEQTASHLKECNKTLKTLYSDYNFEIQEIAAVLQWAEKHTFWSSALTSLCTLTNKGKGGQIKFKTMYTQFLNDKTQHHISPTNYSSNYENYDTVQGVKF